MRMNRAWGCMNVALAAALAGTLARAQTTERVSVATGGAQGNYYSGFPSISTGGRFVAFSSLSTTLVAGDSNGHSDIFVRDRGSGTTERATVDSGGAQANYDSYLPSISADGRYVAFQSNASNLVPGGDTNGVSDVFVRDRPSGTTELVSTDLGGAPGNNDSVAPSISADGRYVAFQSYAWNLVAGDANGYSDVFVRDRQTGATELVSVGSSGVQGNAASFAPSISADGRFVAFESGAANLVPGDTNGATDIFVRDRLGGTIERVSVDAGGAQGNSYSEYPSISADGRFVAFVSAASNLVAGDTNQSQDVFVHDRLSGTTERASVDSSGAQGDSNSYVASVAPSLSADGRYVAFESLATNLVAGDTNGVRDVFVRDMQAGTTERVSVDSNGAQANAYSSVPSISADGAFLAFVSIASNLVAGDTNAAADIFVRKRNAPGFTSVCDPGLAGVIACPCSNPPAGPQRGCDNSSFTGGATLSAWGLADLSSDSLVFTTDAERPIAPSIVLQGNAAISSGIAFGQGVRCVGGVFKRLYVKTATNGSITAPELGAGDPPISTRSAALGDTIQAGQSRWYLVYYRDPLVQGGCPASSTFNATQSGRVDWSP